MDRETCEHFTAASLPCAECRILELETELAAGVHTCGPTCRKTPRCKERADLLVENERMRALLRDVDEMTDARWPGFATMKAEIKAVIDGAAP